jgi:hypothetical protein
MFPHDYFAAGAFAPDYFPPVGSAPVPPVIPPRFGHRPRNQPVPIGWPVDLDDEELMFWIM